LWGVMVGRLLDTLLLLERATRLTMEENLI
jgi:hypothetical protein